MRNTNVRNLCHKALKLLCNLCESHSPEVHAEKRENVLVTTERINLFYP